MDRIGFLGLGIMGSRMAANLAAAGHPLTVWNRTQGKAQAWARDHPGTAVAATPAEVAEASDVLITMLVDGDQVRGVAEQLSGPPKLLIDMSTIGPAAAREIAAALPEGWRFLDAPVTGSSPRGRGRHADDHGRWRGRGLRPRAPALRGHGARCCCTSDRRGTVKLINNAVSAVNAGTLAQALLVGSAIGVDLDALVRVMGSGSGASLMLELKAEPMRQHDYTTLFKLEHMLKDVRLCLEEAERTGVPFPAADATGEALAAAAEAGHGREDFAAILASYEDRAGRRLSG